MISSTQDFYTQANAQIVKVFNAFVQQYNLKNMAQADHVCYKCDSADSFDHIRKLFEPGARMIQSLISKRRCALIEIPERIPTALGDIALLELSDQKPDNSQTEGFDHIEVYPINGTTYDDLVRHLKSKGLEVKEIVRPHHTTHDIPMGNGYILRLTHEPLLEKVCKEIRGE